MSDFRRGDNVVLKSGGPAMTVSAVEGGKVICIRVDDEKSVTTRKAWRSFLIPPR
jgi:uncharacterized protein YodC (DUF2158 family)